MRIIRKHNKISQHKIDKWAHCRELEKHPNIHRLAALQFQLELKQLAQQPDQATIYHYQNLVNGQTQKYPS